MSNQHSSDIQLEPFDNRRLSNLCGRFDEHLHQIEKRLKVRILNRGNVFHIIGTKQSVQKTIHVLQTLYLEANHDLTPNHVHLALQAHPDEPMNKPAQKSFSLRTRRGEIKARTPNQQIYIENISNFDLNFGIGPAGTGKTFLAAACAVAALDQEKVERILLIRPAVEAGERLGFLPGDLTQKIDPYLRPLYDALYELLGFERVSKLIERQVIEIASLAYLRGRTLNNTFIILDEAQNTTIEQMKMFLTRLGFGSTAVVTGDITQIDLPKGKPSGLTHVIDVLKDVRHMSFTFFQSTDVVRHPLVQQIINAYERYEKRTKDDV